MVRVPCQKELSSYGVGRLSPDTLIKAVGFPNVAFPRPP
jgi:hypothetical protein